MRRVLMLCACRLQFFGPIAVLLFIGAAPAHAQRNEFQFNDAHFHLTNSTALWSQRLRHLVPCCAP
jgi:hypothetical protein